MGMFSNLINKVSNGSKRVGYALGVIDCLDSNKDIPLFSGSASFKGKSRWQVLDEMHTGFRETERIHNELVDLPRDDLDNFEVQYGKIAYRPAIDEFARAKNIINERKAKNFSSYLESTLADYDRKAWNTDEVYELKGDKAVGSKLTESNVRKTLEYYARKLSSVVGNKGYAPLLERVSKIIGNEYASV